MTPGDPQIVRFEDFEFSTVSGELRRGDIAARLEPQPARVLAVLVERAGDVVTRAELQQRVWSDDTFVDFERGLNYCIAQIRTALGDSASQPRFIETLPRRGYRFVARVQDAPVPMPPVRRRPPMGAVAAAVAILAIVLAVTWMVVGHRPAAVAAGDHRVRVAVVPFDNETGVAEYDRLAQSLTDATVARLAANPDRLAVIGNAAILRQPRQTRNLEAIGRTLGVGHVIFGQVQQIGGQLRITTHLIRIDNQTHMWAQRFEPSADETAQLDRQVSEAVAGAVAKRLLGS
jgi:DNA-binding winged helix-turn-helix (wHTH) protein/TolB-like protein